MKRISGLWTAVLALGALALAVGLVACGGSSESDSSDPAETTAAGGADGEFEVVRMGTVSNMMHAAEFVAVEKGFFAENGLDVKLKLFSSGSDLNKALAAGDIQIGTASTTSVPASRAAGLLTRLVGPAMNDATTATFAGPLGIIGRKDRGIRDGDAASLRGKRVGVLTGSTTEEYLRLYLEENGMEIDDVTVVNLEVPDHPVSLKQGDVDAVSSWEPFVAQEVAELGDNAVVVSRGDPLLGYVIGVSSTDEGLKNRATLEKFVGALAQANQYLRQNPDEGAEISSHFIKGLNVDHAAVAMRDHLRFDPRISGCTAEAFAVAARGMVESGDIKSAPPVEEMLSPEIVAAVEEQHPEWFDDLPPIPSECDE